MRKTETILIYILAVLLVVFFTLSMLVISPICADKLTSDNLSQEDIGGAYDENGNVLESDKVYDMPKEILFAAPQNGNYTNPQAVNLKFNVTPISAIYHGYTPVVSFERTSGWEFYQPNTVFGDKFNLSWDNPSMTLRLESVNPFSETVYVSLVLADTKVDEIISKVYTNAVCAVQYQSRSRLLSLWLGSDNYYNLDSSRVVDYDFYPKGGYVSDRAFTNHRIDYEITEGINKDVFKNYRLYMILDSNFVVHIREHGINTPGQTWDLKQNSKWSGMNIFSNFFGDPNSAQNFAKVQEALDTWNSPHAWIHLYVETENYPSGKLHKYEFYFGNVVS